MSGSMRGAAGGAVLLLLLVAGGIGAGRLSAQAPQRQPYMEGACASCHDSDAVLRAQAAEHAGSVSCLDCHHIGLQTTDRSVLKARQLKACRSCHETEAAQTGHGAGDATCLDCHVVHGEPRLDWAKAQLSARCASCHGQPHELHAGVKQDAPLCVDCHDVHGTREHPASEEVRTAASGAGEEGATPMTAACVSCHADVHPSHPKTGANAVDCVQCHEPDAALPVARDSVKLAAACVSCHESAHHTHQGVGEGAPLCTDCHSFADDPPVTELSGTVIADRCAACHADAMQEYLRGGHSVGLTAPESHKSVPTCLTCHADMLQGETNSAPDRMAATSTCIGCHSNKKLAETYGLSTTVVKSYQDDYHGTTLGFMNAMGSADSVAVLTCEDCHGAHAVGWSKEKVVSEVCERCHEHASPQLAGAWLGHEPPGPHNQLPTWLVSMFYYFLIPFMLIGLSLIILSEALHGQRHRAWSRKIRSSWARLTGKKSERPRMIRRFSPWEQVQHALGLTTFITLVVTGLPQLRPDLAVADSVIAFFGSIGTTRMIHRIAGFSFATLLVVHVGLAILNAIRKRRMPIMLPTLDDFDKAIGTVRHFMEGTPRPKVGKFDFAQKFEYGGLLMGGLVMTFTGIALVWPELATRLVPGEWMAAMRTMHGYEATFATLVVVLWHSWGVVFRPEIFPLDTSIFTGKVSIERLKEEHWLEYQRLFPDEAAREPAVEGAGRPAGETVAGQRGKTGDVVPGTPPAG